MSFLIFFDYYSSRLNNQICYTQMQKIINKKVQLETNPSLHFYLLLYYLCSKLKFLVKFHTKEMPCYYYNKAFLFLKVYG